MRRIVRAVIVRAARSHDFDAVTRLLEELGRPEVTEETRDACRAVFEAQVLDPEAAHLVAEADDGAVVGFCSLHFRPRLNHLTPQAWVPDLIVAPTARRAGVGLALLEEAERQARGRGCHDLTLESAHFRTDAHRLYTRFAMTQGALAFWKSLND